MVCVAAVLLPVWTLGGSAINTERVRSPGVYLLQANRPGGGTFEVGPVVFVVSWATGYGGTVLGVFVGGFGTWLGWYTRRHGPAVESSASTGPAGG